jgi:hypothetical protein
MTPPSDCLTVTVKWPIVLSIREEIAETINEKFIWGTVIHYSKHAYAINFTIPVIKPLKGNPVLGQRVGFSTVRTVSFDV